MDYRLARGNFPVISRFLVAGWFASERNRTKFTTLHIMLPSETDSFSIPLEGLPLRGLMRIRKLGAETVKRASRTFDIYVLNALVIVKPVNKSRLIVGHMGEI